MIFLWQCLKNNVIHVADLHFLEVPPGPTSQKGIWKWNVTVVTGCDLVFQAFSMLVICLTLNLMYFPSLNIDLE